MKKLQRQKGFTLVELAIVLTIIGLLIGGILKGQQLIANARVTAQLAQFKAVEAALTTFSDTYNGLPGDMLAASTRVSNCTAALCPDGNANGQIGAANGATPAYATVTAGENVAFWQELSAAGLLSGVGTPIGGAYTIGNGIPNAKVAGSGLVVAQMTGGTVAANGVANGGLYSAIVTGAGFTAAAGTQSLTPGQAAQIDRKSDDGIDTTGDIVGAGLAASCTTAPTAAQPSGYLENLQTKDCNLWAKIQ